MRGIRDGNSDGTRAITSTGAVLFSVGEGAEMTAACRILVLLMALALTACATPREQATPGIPPRRAERPTYQLGEKWILNDGVYELIRIENDR